MKFVQCPDIGRRALSEFVYGGVQQAEPDHTVVSEKEWADFLFYRHSHPQVQLEWWYHRPTGIWFLFKRNTLTDEILKVSLASKGEVDGV